MSYRQMIDEAAAMIASKKENLLAESDSLGAMSFEELKSVVYNARLQQHSLKEGSVEKSENDNRIAVALEVLEYRQLHESTGHSIGASVWVKHPTDKSKTLTGKITKVGRTGYTVQHKDGSAASYPHKDVTVEYPHKAVSPANESVAMSPDQHYAKQSPVMQNAINLHLRKGKSYKEAVAAARVHVKESTELDEAHKIGDIVVMHHSTLKGVKGTIGEIRHGAYKGAPKTYTIDYQHPKHSSQHQSSIQLSSNEFKGHKSGTLGEGLDEHIVKHGSGYRILSKSTGKNLGDFDTIEAAKKHEQEIEYFKHKNESVLTLSDQAKTTLKHIKDPSLQDKYAAYDIKPGVKGYRDRINILRDAKAKGKLKEESEEISESEAQDRVTRAMDRIDPSKRSAARKLYNDARSKGLPHASALNTMTQVHMKEDAKPVTSTNKSGKKLVSAFDVLTHAKKLATADHVGKGKVLTTKEHIARARASLLGEAELDEALKYQQKLTHVRVDPINSTPKHLLGKIGVFGEKDDLSKDEHYTKAIADAHEYGKTKFDGKYEITHVGQKQDKIRGGSVAKVRKQMSEDVIDEDATDRKHNAIRAMIADHEARANSTKNDIKKNHHMQMASDLRRSLPVSDNTHESVLEESAHYFYGRDSESRFLDKAKELHGVDAKRGRRDKNGVTEYHDSEGNAVGHHAIDGEGDHTYNLYAKKRIVKEDIIDEGILKNIKRGMQGWGGVQGKPREVANRAKNLSDKDVKSVHSAVNAPGQGIFGKGEFKDPNKHSPAGLQKRVLDREMKKRGLGEEGSQFTTNDSDLRKKTRAQISKLTNLVIQAGNEGDQAKCDMYKKKIEALKQKIPPLPSVREEVESIDEISTETKQSYLPKAVDSHYKEFTGRKPTTKEKLDKRRGAIQKVSKELTGKKHFIDFGEKNESLIEKQKSVLESVMKKITK